MTRRAKPQTTRLPVPAGELPPFTPVPRQCERHDGWTPQRQRAFIEALADTGSVAAACKAVDMSQPGAYYLRRQPGAESFRAAWAAALDLGVQRIEDVAMDRALNGVEEPLYSYGHLIGTRRRYNDRLLMFMLRNRAPERFAQGQPKGLNAVNKAELERLKQEWRSEWEAELRTVSPQEVRASIDRKIAGIRLRLEREKQQEWAQLSEETRAAWDAFVALRNRDLDALGADAEQRRRLAEGPRENTPEAPTAPPPGWREKPALPAPKTRWGLTDEGFGKG